MGKIVVFTGGARSGKSANAERYAALQHKPVVYIATAEARDGEMQDRIALHRVRRPAEWQTLEVPQHIGSALREVAAGSVVLLDCLTLLVSNVLLAHEADPEPAVDREIVELLAIVHERDLLLIVVTNEVGMGLVPEYPLGRIYRDLLGRATQRIAAAADEVYLVIAGMVVELRALQPAWAKAATQ